MNAFKNIFINLLFIILVFLFFAVIHFCPWWLSIPSDINILLFLSAILIRAYEEYRNK
jgi:hypothetical protein